MIECTCGDKDCTARMLFDAGCKTIMVEGHKGRADQLFYLTPDMIVKFIHELKEMLDYIVDNPKL